MITNYEIKIPSVIKPGETFTVRVVARDGTGTLVPDNATQVTVSATAQDIQFDGNANDVFGELGDDVKSLVSGVAEFLAKDIKSPTFSISVTDASNRQGLGQGEYKFNVIVFQEGVTYRTEVQNYDLKRFTGRFIDVGSLAPPPSLDNALAQDSFFTLGKAL